MNTILIILFSNLVSLAFVVTGGILAYNKKEGWGWCFFLALLTYSILENIPK